MAEEKDKYTVFQRMNYILSGAAKSGGVQQAVNQYNISHGARDKVLDTASTPEEYARKLLQMRQQKHLASQWYRTTGDIENRSLAGLNDVKLMYRDCDLMDGFPEIGTALDIVTEEACCMGANGKIVNVSSKSDRVKSVLEDLFENRLTIGVTLPMITRGMVKYGNEYNMLNLDVKNGVIGWKELPVYEMERYENGMQFPYKIATMGGNETPTGTRFVWVGSSDMLAYRNFQIAHFRLLYDSQMLPYGTSFLHKARRHFRMLSMMEDMMLLYRLDRSVERRVFKVNVGAIDAEDVPAYVQEVANSFKRTPIIDPLTGQIDTRKNIMPVWAKTPIPLVDGRTITIEELADEYDQGKTNYVYSVQAKTLSIVPGKVVWCGKNYRCQSMMKVTFEDGSYAVTAPEHEFLLRDGSRRRADMLKEGVSVMPYYVSKDEISDDFREDHEKIYNPHSGKYEYTHRLMADGVKKGKEIYDAIRHKDLNWSSANSCDCKEREKSMSELKTEFWQDEEKAKKAVDGMTVKFDDYVWDELRMAVVRGEITGRDSLLDYVNGKLIGHLIETNTNKRLKRLGKISRTVLEARLREMGFHTTKSYLECMRRNHKVKMIERIDDGDVYCMSVVGPRGEQDRHNFAIKAFSPDGGTSESGCFVANCNVEDFFIPILPGQDYTPIETLSAGQNLTAMDDIKFIQDKIVTALRVPKSFLNFEEAQGDGKNLSLLDVRFTRTVNRIQQALLMELNKIAIIHLSMLGFWDDLTNFKLTMNNPSSQADMLELENLAKKVATAKDAVSDPGGGIPLTSMMWAWRNIFKWSDKEIQQNLDELRLETALAVELQKTNQIIKKSGVFDSVDNIYGEPGAEYSEEPEGGREGGPGGGPGGPGGGGGMGMGMPGDLDFGEGEAAQGEEGDLGMEQAEAEDNGQPEEGGMPPMGPQESIGSRIERELKKGKRRIDEESKRKIRRNEDILYNRVAEKMMSFGKARNKALEEEPTPIYDKGFLINEELDKMASSLKGISKEDLAAEKGTKEKEE